MKTVYLCGGINGLSDDMCCSWRNQCDTILKEKYTILDPMRRDYRGKEDENVNQIVLGDYLDISKSDIVLCNATKPSWGTAMEIHHAYNNLNKLVVIVADNRISPWLRYHSHVIFKTFSDACNYLLEIE